MGKISTCPCGFTVISPLGDDDVTKHMSMHLKDAHPATAMTEDEIRKTIVSV
jgi:predicted small metal-binding protein